MIQVNKTTIPSLNSDSGYFVNSFNEMIIESGEKVPFENKRIADEIIDNGKMLEKMIDDGDICVAEDLLFNDLDQSDSSWLQIALDFYSKLNNCSDDYLAMHDFSREEIDQGLRYICTLFGYDFLVSN